MVSVNSPLNPNNLADTMRLATRTKSFTPRDIQQMDGALEAGNTPRINDTPNNTKSTTETGSPSTSGGGTVQGGGSNQFSGRDPATNVGYVA